MERNNNLNNNLKDQSLGGKITRENYYNNNTNVFKSTPWEYCSSSSRNPNYAEEYMGQGFSWPPRSYICSFCKREFRSAQALGGHMNVHRRDRARLRLQSPPRDINLNLNPNPNFLTTPPPPSTTLHPSYTTTCTLPSLVSPSTDGALLKTLISPKGSDLIKTKAVKSLFGGLTQERECDVVMKKAEFVSLELGIGLHSNFKEEHVDLELRLGYS